MQQVPGAFLTWVFAHVDEADGLPGGVQRPLHHGLRGAHESVDGAVGGGAGVDVQQAAARGAADGRRDGIDDLKPKNRDLFKRELDRDWTQQEVLSKTLEPKTQGEKGLDLKIPELFL